MDDISLRLGTFECLLDFNSIYFVVINLLWKNKINTIFPGQMIETIV